MAMKRILDISLIGLILALMFLSVRTALLIDVCSRVAQDLPKIADRRIGEALSVPESLATNGLAGAMGVLYDIQRDLGTSQARLLDIASQAATDAGKTVQEAVTRADRQLTQANVTLDSQLGRLNDSISEVAKLRADVQPSIEGVNLLMRRDALPAQLLGTLGATKVTMGEAAQTMKDVRDAMPALLADSQKLVENSDRTTASTAQVMDHLATATKPLPSWARIGLAVAPPLAGVAAGVATTYSLTGGK